jgi:exopolysaccharide biosynthesis polyprenyl glycosylphosphotransferase
VTSLVSVADIAPLGSVPDRNDARERPPRARSRSLVVPATAAADLLSVGLVAVLTHLGPARLTAAVGLGVLWSGLLLVTGGYRRVSARTDRPRATAVVRAGAALAIVCWAMPSFIEVPASPRQLMAVTLALTCLGAVSRFAVGAWSGHVTVARGGSSVVVAGDAEAVARALAELRRRPRGGWSVASACVTRDSGEVDVDVPVAIGVDDVAGMAVASGADAVLLLPCRDLDPPSVRRLGWQLEAEGVRLYVGTGLLDVAPARTAAVSVGDLHLVQLRESSAAPGRRAKAAAERCAAALALVLLAPALAVVALAIRLDSPGSPVFRQVRVGRDGREFTMYKFRTMTVDAEDVRADLVERNESDGAVLFKIRQDPRITRVGAFLRRYSVDELPQLLNVVRGDMALVGPRPALPGEVAQYDLDPRRRLAVRPGLTGLWQVSGRSDLSWEDTVRLDLHYVDNWSLGLDALIVCRTLRAVLGHDGAY